MIFSQSFHKKFFSTFYMSATTLGIRERSTDKTYKNSQCHRVYKIREIKQVKYTEKVLSVTE